MLQGVKHVPAFCSQRSKGLAVHIAACSISGAIGAVAAHREHCCVPPCNGGSCRKGQFLIPPAEALAGQVDDRLTACDKGQLFPVPRVGADDGAKKAARFPGLTAKLIGQQDGLIAQFPAGIGRSGAQFPHTAGDPGGHVVQRFGRFLLQQRLCLFRQV